MIPLVILAGGRATRLAALSSDRPKFLAPVDPERCFADVQLAWVRAQGFRDVTLSVGYRAEMIRAHVGDGHRFGLEVRYAEDGELPLGTGGAVKRAFPVAPQAVAVLYGDTVLDLDCREVVEAARGALALMTVMVAPPGEQPNATLEGGLVRYDKRAPQPTWRHIDYGLSVLSDRFLTSIPDTTPLDLAEPLGAASRHGELRGFLATRPYQEINTPEALQAFQARFGLKGGGT
jgi:NDP-sugar pyrophosphorylase family protein